jgi:subtilisin-like proprotein convertase family protein
MPMKDFARKRLTALSVSLVLVAGSASAVFALQVKEQEGRFDRLVVEDPTNAVGVATTPTGSLPALDLKRAGWEQFRAAHGQEWSVYLDRRSGAPLLVEGQGIPWPLEKEATVDSIAASLRPFIAGNRALLLTDDAELVLDRNASGPLTDDVWQIVFAREIAGVPVAGERYLFTIGHGNLISFGAPRWSRIDASPLPAFDDSEAQELLAAYMGLTADDKVDFFRKPTLEFIPLHAAGTQGGPGPFAGPVGSGYASALVWRVSARIEGEPGTWVALVDAHSGAIRSFVDDNRYARVKGGVYPISDDQICPDGCEQLNHPMPFADVTIDANNLTTSTHGIFTCTPGGSTATTTLAGKYIRVADICGPISQSVSCIADIDLSGSGGIDCDVPAGSSPGNTHAARSSFYHLNRIAEHARSWLTTDPAKTWLASQVVDNVNLNQTCNAYWNGSSVNFFKSGGGCNNTGEIASVFLHEWGHGLDDNDGGGQDNPGEAYADVTSLLSTHVSCLGRGFRPTANCGGNGNACLNCTGVRELDWDQRANHTPSTPGGFVANYCPLGSGPCGREVHCEGHVGAETLWDLAVRDLPAAGLDQATSWQVADRLWYKSRLGSGGNSYNCSLPNSDGCSASSWFQKLRAVDDDDGNLANGTPHAAAIFAAFNRHKIACGAAGDASNQSTTICPAIGAATLSGTAGSTTAQMTWTAVPNAVTYRLLRNDAGCQAGSTRVAVVGGTSFTDAGLATGFPVYYTVQALTANAACDGPVSNCQAVTPQPSAGSVVLNAGVYSCSSSITVTVNDSNIGAGTTTASLTSTTEASPESITLTRVAPGSASYSGTITVAGSAPAHDGVLQVGNGDTITATYIDANNGAGGLNVPRVAQALTDCAIPSISKVEATHVTGSTAKITWSTNEAATSAVHYGTVAPPGSTTSGAGPVSAHTVDLAGLNECTTYSYSVESTDALANTALDNASGAYYTFATGKTTSFAAGSSGPVPIPDNDPAGGTSTITVSRAATVQDVNVSVNITHIFDGSLTLKLITPNGIAIALANQRGGVASNYPGTVFDDEAATAIASATPPFVGSFRPESPLSVADGLNAAGDWKLVVVDGSAQYAGTIQQWSLNFTFVTPSCGPHAVYRSEALVADSCSEGGPGNANTAWDAGEQVQFKVNLANDGTTTLTGVTATIGSTTPGVVMLDDTASYPDLSEGSSGDSLAPHFTAQLPTSLACGGTVSFLLTIHSNEGAWLGAFTQTLGVATNGTGTVLDETFATGIPETWAIDDGGTGGVAAATWTTANPGIRTIASPMVIPVAIVDSDAAGASATQDEGLLTSILDLSTAAVVTLQFDQYFNWYSGGQGEIADVDVRSSLTGGAWVNVLRQQDASTANPVHTTLDITAQTAGAPDAQVRFRDYNGQNEWYWQLDNVKIDTTAPGSCNQIVCAASGVDCADPQNDGTGCDDGIACTTGDVCGGGACAGTPIAAPGEAQNFRVQTDKSTFVWDPMPNGPHYDVVRGELSSLPVGPGGGDEACFDDLVAAVIVDATVPSPGTGFWYLSRGVNTCGGNGTYGTWSDGTPRISTTCP